MTVQIIKVCKCGSRDFTTSGQCRPCLRLRSQASYARRRETVRENGKKWHRENLEKSREKVRKSRRKGQGWVEGEHERAEAVRPLVQSCACCGSKDPRHSRGWVADHDHATGLFRAFLCQPCNIVIGFVERYGLEASDQVRAYLAGTK